MKILGFDKHHPIVGVGVDDSGTVEVGGAVVVVVVVGTLVGVTVGVVTGGTAVVIGSTVVDDVVLPTVVVEAAFVM